MSLRELQEAPASYVHTVTVSPAASWDPTTVTLGELLVKRADGTETTWSAVLSGASATQITLTHTLAASGTDIPRGTAGPWSITPKLTLPGGVVYGASVDQTVKGLFDS